MHSYWIFLATTAGTTILLGCFLKYDVTPHLSHPLPQQNDILAVDLDNRQTLPNQSQLPRVSETQVQSQKLDSPSKNQNHSLKSNRQLIVSKQDKSLLKSQPNLGIQKPKISEEKIILHKSATKKITQNESTIKLNKTVSKTKKNELEKGKNKLTATDKQGLEVKLSDIVFLVVQNNRDIKNAYLERIAQRAELAVAEDTFLPDIIPLMSVEYSGLSNHNNDLGSETTNTSEYQLSTAVVLKVPTGGEFNFGWVAGTTSTDINSPRNLSRDQDNFSQSLELNFNQPLLRGAGLAVNRAPIEIARLTEESNIIGLKSTLIDTITSAILAYRNLLQNQEQVAIAEQSLARAQEFLNINQRLIEAGRLARVEIVQSQTEVANRELDLISAQNNFESAMLNLVEIIDIDSNFRLIPTESIEVEEEVLDNDNLVTIAFENRPDYLQAIRNITVAKLRLLQAQSDRRLDLNLSANYRYQLDENNVAADSEQNEWTVGLSITKTFGDLTLEQRWERSRIDVLQTENDLVDLQDLVTIEVVDQIRNVNLIFQQVKQAIRARELAEQQLEIEKKKQSLGRSSIFQVVNFQDALVSARSSELRVKISYLNALTNLDQVLGTTLDTWQIKVEDK